MHCHVQYFELSIFIILQFERRNEIKAERGQLKDRFQFVKHSIGGQLESVCMRWMDARICTIQHTWGVTLESLFSSGCHWLMWLKIITLLQFYTVNSNMPRRCVQYEYFVTLLCQVRVSRLGTHSLLLWVSPHRYTKDLHYLKTHLLLSTVHSLT